MLYLIFGRKLSNTRNLYFNQPQMIIQTMKQKILLFAILIFLGTEISAKQVTVTSAQLVAQNFFTGATQNPNTNLKFQLVYTSGAGKINPDASVQRVVYFYVFNTGTNGFVIVAGDDNVTPVLGYSDKGIFDPENIPANVAKLN